MWVLIIEELSVGAYNTECHWLDSIIKNTTTRASEKQFSCERALEHFE